MIKEALEYIAKLGYDQQKPGRLDIPDPRASRYLIGKEVLSVASPEPPRGHSVQSLDDFLSMVADNTAEQSAPEATVFVDESCVVCVLDNDSFRVERFRFPLTWSDVWKTVKSMAQWKDQKAFIRLLKIDLAGALPENALLNTIRKVKFENGVVTQSEIKKNRESLGKEITSKVETPLDVPDYVTLTVPVYKSLGERDTYPISCSVEIDPVRQDAFRLAPLPDEIERVQYLAVGSILDRLRAALPEGVPCYYGSP